MMDGVTSSHAHPHVSLTLPHPHLTLLHFTYTSPHRLTPTKPSLTSSPRKLVTCLLTPSSYFAASTVRKHKHMVDVASNTAVLAESTFNSTLMVGMGGSEGW